MSKTPLRHPSRDWTLADTVVVVLMVVILGAVLADYLDKNSQRRPVEHNDTIASYLGAFTNSMESHAGIALL